MEEIITYIRPTCKCRSIDRPPKVMRYDRHLPVQYICDLNEDVGGAGTLYEERMYTLDLAARSGLKGGRGTSSTTDLFVPVCLSDAKIRLCMPPMPVDRPTMKEDKDKKMIQKSKLAQMSVWRTGFLAVRQKREIST